MSNIIKVGMADLKVTDFPNGLMTIGLGSCVGVALFDSFTKVIGLAHVMLPDSKLVTNNTNIAKFADTAITYLFEKMVDTGAKKSSIVAKLAGGAQMFSSSQLSDNLRIGERNVLASKEKLLKLGIPIISEDTGGNFGRTIELWSDTGKLFIRTIGYGTKEI